MGRIRLISVLATLLLSAHVLADRQRVFPGTNKQLLTMTASHQASPKGSIWDDLNFPGDVPVTNFVATVNRNMGASQPGTQKMNLAWLKHNKHGLPPDSSPYAYGGSIYPNMYLIPRSLRADTRGSFVEENVRVGLSDDPLPAPELPPLGSPQGAPPLPGSPELLNDPEGPAGPADVGSPLDLPQRPSNEYIMKEKADADARKAVEAQRDAAKKHPKDPMEDVNPKKNYELLRPWEAFGDISNPNNDPTTNMFIPQSQVMPVSEMQAKYGAEVVQGNAHPDAQMSMFSNPDHVVVPTPAPAPGSSPSTVGSLPAVVSHVSSQAQAHVQGAANQAAQHLKGAAGSLLP